MAILFENEVSPEFIDKAQEIATKLDIPLNWLMGIIQFESAGTFSASITNSLGYVGLIQFGSAAAERLGTTQEKLSQMSEVEQLDFVYGYYVIYKSKLKSYVDMYIATLFPVALGKPSSYVLETKNISAEKVANANPIFDLDNNSKITVGEVEKYMINRLPESFRYDLKKKVVL